MDRGGIPSLSMASDSQRESRPLAPSTEAVPLSPNCHQPFTDKMRISPCPDSSDQVGVADSDSDEAIVDSIYQNLLESVVALQIRGSGGNNPTELWAFNDCKTPVPVHCPYHQQHNPDTCPGAPVKPSMVSRNNLSGSRRNLF
ncbi:PREDICTED: uncharacterized protein LOC104806274 [Tarenaya hassleriana]|uniref:uncharacterized protein LOC104806274 n=1 Tax=Tarenaya hassleriana TaxID=28532 RepID=UPI00053C2D2E|nr:PREDICTED: uncharacterized protein LOC104806274 [Tarenaya hassleriana]